MNFYNQKIKEDKTFLEQTEKSTINFLQIINQDNFLKLQSLRDKYIKKEADFKGLISNKKDFEERIQNNQKSIKGIENDLEDKRKEYQEKNDKLFEELAKLKTPEDFLKKNIEELEALSSGTIGEFSTFYQFVVKYKKTQGLNQEEILQGIQPSIKALVSTCDNFQTERKFLNIKGNEYKALEELNTIYAIMDDNKKSSAKELKNKKLDEINYFFPLIATENSDEEIKRALKIMDEKINKNMEKRKKEEDEKKQQEKIKQEEAKETSRLREMIKNYPEQAAKLFASLTKENNNSDFELIMSKIQDTKHPMGSETHDAFKIFQEKLKEEELKKEELENLKMLFKKYREEAVKIFEESQN